MHHFTYRGADLFCEEVPLARIASEVGTPVYVYSRATLVRHFRVFAAAFAGQKHLICYSVKANSNLAVLRTLFALGAGADIVSAGELGRALRAGCVADKIVFSGVGKRSDEIALALEAGILAFNVESLEELENIDAVAARLGRRAPISLRVNPDVDAHTHRYIATGREEDKFGLSVNDAHAAYRRALALGHLDLVGIDCHIGSQLMQVAPFSEAIARTTKLARELGEEGAKLDFLDIGGGLGIPYDDDDLPPSPADYARAVREALAPLTDLNLTLVMEPGRVLVGNAGVLVTEVLYRKSSGAKNFVIVDAAFNDLLRPAFYDSHHAVKPVCRRESAPAWTCDVVGPICETGDFLARDRTMERPERGDLLAMMSAGAYGFVMASNYNSRPRAAEVLVHEEKFALVRRRESIDDLFRDESIPEWA